MREHDPGVGWDGKQFDHVRELGAISAHRGSGINRTRPLAVSAMTARFVNGWTSRPNCNAPLKARFEIAGAAGNVRTARILCARKSATVTVWLNVFVLTHVLVK